MVAARALAGRQASYPPLVFLLAIATVGAFDDASVRLFYHRRVRRAPPWDCGFGALNARMQDTAEGFGQPIRHIFEPFFAMQARLAAAVRPRTALSRHGRAIGSGSGCTLPLGTLVQRIADAFAWLQQGRISTYLLYSFVTLIVLLALVL